MRFGLIRLRIALAAGLLVAAGVGAMAVVAMHYRGMKSDETARKYLLLEVANYVDRYDPHALSHNEYDTWLVDTSNGNMTPLGYIDFVGAPVTQIARDTFHDGPFIEEFTLNGDLYAAAGARVPQSPDVIVSTFDMTQFQDNGGSASLWIALGGAGAAVASGAIVWAITGMSLRNLRRSEQTQRDFLANAAHELRTPITVVQASSSQALARERSAEEYRGALSEIRTAAERATRAISDMFDLARLEAGETKVSRMPLRIDLLAEEVAGSVQSSRPGSDVEAVSTGPVVARGDDTLLRQAIENTVVNAARQARQVRVNVSCDDRRATIEVFDDGPGFDPEILPYVFDRYRQGTDSSAGGAGLGLAIVRSIAEAHGGTATASNRSEGGALVTIQIPV